MTRNKWFDELHQRKVKQKATAERIRTKKEDEIALFDAQMDALVCMTDPRAFINAVDRATLMNLISGMRNLNTPNQPSPLTQPVVNEIDEAPKLFRIRPKRYVGEGQMESGSKDADLNLLVARTITFAHKRKQRPQRERVPHRTAPVKPQGKASAINLSALNLMPKPSLASLTRAATEASPEPASPAPAAEPPARMPPKHLGFGLRWFRVGSEKPSNRVLLNNDAFSKALEHKTTFSRAEFDAFWPAGVPEVRKEHVVKSGNAYFQPNPILQPSKSWRESPPVPVPSAPSAARSPSSSSEAKEQEKRDLAAQKRMNARFPLGLVHKQLVEQREDAVRRATEKALLHERISASKRNIFQCSTAVLTVAPRPAPTLRAEPS